MVDRLIVMKFLSFLVCSFGATIIDIPDKASERENMTAQADQRIQEYVDESVTIYLLLITHVFIV